MKEAARGGGRVQDTWTPALVVTGHPAHLMKLSVLGWGGREMG